MITLDDISLTLGGKQVVNHLTATIRAGQRIALVGRNGSGKSTLLKVIAGQIKPDEGAVGIERDKKIAYMPQELSFNSEKPVLDEAMMVFERLLTEKHELDSLLTKLDRHEDNDVAHLVERVGVLTEKLHEINFDKLRQDAREMLEGLGFNEQQLAQPTNTLSLGWKMRLVLTKLLLTKADFYLFDEPTNHLDIIAKDWFLEFIQASSFGFLLICHDRYFLDALCDHTIDMDQQPNKLYNGNYSRFKTQRELEIETIKAAAANQEKMIKAKMATIERFKAKASKAKMAQSMMKDVDEIERIHVPHEHKIVTIGLPSVTRAGRIVLSVKDLSKKFGESTIFRNASFEILRGEKVAIVAANGKGKTTLLRSVMGQLSPDSGSITFGLNVEPSFFEQDQDKVLKHSLTVLEEAEHSCTTSEQRGRIRGLLGAFLFPGDDVHKKIGVLSGGEKNRVAMVKTLIGNRNFLLLDEPTNHLDLQSKEVLLKALQEFDGTILFVSHDRAFLDDLATRILELTPTGVHSYEGNYESFLQQSHHLPSVPAISGIFEAQELTTPVESTQSFANPIDTARRPSTLSGKEQHEMRKQLGKAERTVEKLEREIEQQSIKLGSLTFGTPPYREVNERVAQLRRELDTATAEWESLMEKL